MSIWTILALVVGFFIGKKWGNRVNLDPELLALKDLLDKKKKEKSEEEKAKEKEDAVKKLKDLIGS